MSKRNKGYNSIPGYRPIETKADRRAESIKNFQDGLICRRYRRGRCRPSRASPQPEDHREGNLQPYPDRQVIPQGADETAKAFLFSNSASPWPGSSGPAPIPPPLSEPEQQSIHEAGSRMVTPKEGPSDPYLSGRGYEPSTKTTSRWAERHVSRLLRAARPIRASRQERRSRPHQVMTFLSSRTQGDPMNPSDSEPRERRQPCQQETATGIAIRFLKQSARASYARPSSPS